MPGLLRLLDDPYGINWRIRNQLSRFSARSLARFLAGYVRPPRYTRPIFVLGAPRSGTTMLFHALRASNHLGGLPREGHDVWRMYHHPRYHGWRSDAVGAGELGPGEARFVNAYFFAYVGRRRFVEKTPENCLRVGYLLDLFPDARFVVIHRNPCDVINSLITAWRDESGKYRSYFLPEDLSIPGYDARRRWCFVLVEGWRELKSSPVPQIAFAQWKQSLEGLADARSLVSADRWTEIHFERLLSEPSETLHRLCTRLDIPREAALDEALSALVDRPVNASSPPGHDKWRHQNRSDIEPLLPRISEVASLAGYDVDRRTGTASRIGNS